jgi:hypothetical protein
VRPHSPRRPAPRPGRAASRASDYFPSTRERTASAMMSTGSRIGVPLSVMKTAPCCRQSGPGTDLPEVTTPSAGSGGLRGTRSTPPGSCGSRPRNRTATRSPSTTSSPTRICWRCCRAFRRIGAAARSFSMRAQAALPPVSLHQDLSQDRRRGRLAKGPVQHGRARRFGVGSLRGGSRAI